MPKNPLAPPTDNELLKSYLSHFSLRAIGNKRDLLHRLAKTFAFLPYENLTKAIRIADEGSPARARRDPKQVLQDHFSTKTGGTCFSLSATLIYLIRSLGWNAEPILANRKYGDNTHSAIIVWIDQRPHLLDPGYLIVDPLPLDLEEPQKIETSFNELILSPQRKGDEVVLHTVQQGKRTYRLTFKTQPVDAGDFLKVWDSSFGWDMMRYPVLTQVRGKEQYYLQENRIQIRNHKEVRHQKIETDEMVQQIVACFGVGREIVARAIDILKKGDSRFK